MNKKKIILYITFIPYIYVVLSSIYFAIFGMDCYTKICYGSDAVINNLSDFYLDFLLDNIALGIFVLLCIIYQIWYFISGKSNKNPNKKFDLKKFFFVISCSIWILYFLSAVFAARYGYSFFFSYYDGFDGFEAALIGNFIKLGVIIPILPITLIYIIIYVFKIKKDKKQ